MLISAIAALGVITGCPQSRHICSVDLCSPAEFYVDGKLCATNLVPRLETMESENVIVRVNVREPTKLCARDLIRFMWDVVSYADGVLVLPGGGEIAFGAGPDYVRCPQSPRIAFTSTRIHYQKGHDTLSRPISELSSVCAELLSDNNRGDDSAIEFGFQADRTMKDVLGYLQVARDVGFKLVRVFYYYGGIQDDHYEFE